MRVTGGLHHLHAPLKDMRLVGDLIDALDLYDSTTQAIVMEILTRLLPTLKASDASLITEAQRAILYRQITNTARPMKTTAATCAAIARSPRPP